jgi:hypothetical protein
MGLGSATKATTSHKGKEVVAGTAIARPSAGGVNVHGVGIYCNGWGCGRVTVGTRGFGGSWAHMELVLDDAVAHLVGVGGFLDNS